MDAITFWRGLAVGGFLGWAVTAWMWQATGSLEPQPSLDAPTTDGSARAAAPRPVVPRAAPVHVREATPPREDRSSGAPDGALLEEARQQIMDEMREERRAHHERMLEERVDQLWDFVSDEGLDDATGLALEEALLELHDTLSELGPPGPPGPPRGGTDRDQAEGAERRERADEAFGAFHDRIDAVLDEETAEALHETLRPPGPPGPPGGRPR